MFLFLTMQIALFLSRMLYHVFNGANVIILAFFLVFFVSLSSWYWIESWTKEIKTNHLFICHWNLNSTSAQNSSKIAQLKAYNSIYKHDLTYKTNNEFNQLLLNFDKIHLHINQQKPFLILVTGDFNSRSSFRWSVTLTLKKEQNCFH